MKILTLVVMLAASTTGCTSLNKLTYVQLSGETFKIKQTINSDILCVKTKRKSIVCYHVTGKNPESK